VLGPLCRARLWFWVNKMKEKKEKRSRKQDELDKEFPPWEPVDLRLQDREFFVSIRQLQASGINPKLPGIEEIVKPVHIEEIFGEEGKLKTTNTFLDPKTLRDLYRLYWQIFGTSHVTNNDLAGWIVNGYIAQEMGEDVDWATAAASTAKERLRRQVATESDMSVERMTIGGLDVEAVFDDVSKMEVKVEADIKQAIMTKQGACPYHISKSMLDRVQGVHSVLLDLLNRARRKIVRVGDDKKQQEEKIIGLKFKMYDRKALAEEARLAISVVEAEVCSLDNQLKILQDKVSMFLHFLFMSLRNAVSLLVLTEIHFREH
jgi:hypothetical protein